MADITIKDFSIPHASFIMNNLIFIGREAIDLKFKLFA